MSGTSPNRPGCRFAMTMADFAPPRRDEVSADSPSSLAGFGALACGKGVARWHGPDAHGDRAAGQETVAQRLSVVVVVCPALPAQQFGVGFPPAVYCIGRPLWNSSRLLVPPAGGSLFHFGR
jgi:hypothetical protein